MKYAVIAARVLMGLGFIVFGANIIHPFLPMPPLPEGSPTAQFMALMVPTHWMLVVGVVQFVGGILVLSGAMTPLGLVFLGPVLVNILAFHICIQNGEGLGPGLVFSALELFLLWAYSGYFRALMRMDAQPTL